MTLEQIYKENVALIKSVAKKKGVHYSEIEDVAHDIIIKIHKNQKLHNPEKGKFSTWVVAVARNFIISRYRKKKIETLELFDFGHSYTQKDGLIEDDKKREISEWMKRMPKKNQLAIHLYYWEEKSLKEIALELDVPLGTAKTLVFFARAFLKKNLSQSVYEGKRIINTTQRFSKWT